MNSPAILGRQVELIYRNQNLGQIMSIGIALYLAWIANEANVGQAGVMLWGLVAVSVALIRLGMARRYSQLTQKEKDASYLVWHKRVRIGAFASGLAWASGGLWFTLSGDLSLELFTAFALAGITAGAIPVLGPDPVAYRLFAWPPIISVTIGVFGTDHLHLAFASLSVMALIIYTRSANSFNQMLNETFILEHEKGELLDKVNQSLEFAERSDRAKTQFLANISHELRTPMNGIMGLAELLDMEELTEDQRSLVTPLRESASQLMRQIEHLIELSALEAGHVQLQPAPFAVNELLEALLSSQRKSAAEKGLELLQSSDPDMPNVLVGDLTQLRKIFEHLVGNAIKFTEEGSVSISANLLTQQLGGALIEFCITDTGAGISPEKIELISGILTQADGASNRRFSGMGVGLPIARKLIELMGGTLIIESEVGKGSSFSFTLPFEQPDLDAETL